MIWQDDIAGRSGSQFGTGDIVQSAFFSPSRPGPLGGTFGIGPVFLLPTASDDLMGSGKLGIGPTAVALQQTGPWTMGFLANHIWSVAGEGSRSDVNSTFLQPFLAYNTPDAWTFTIQTETTYDWVGSNWNVPINALVSKLVRVGNQPVQFGLGARYWAAAAANGPEGFGARFQVTFLFPK